MSDWIKRFLPFISLIVLCALIAVLEPRFLSAGNLASVARQTAVITIMAMGMTMVMVAGGIDLSVGSIMALAGVVGALAMVAGVPVVGGIAIAMLAGASLGMINGAAVASLGIPAFIVTLGAMGIYRGSVLLLTGGNAVVGLPQSFGYLAEGHFLGLLPIPLLIVIIVAVLIHFLLAQTQLGRYCYAIGSNVEAARYAGVRVARNQIVYYSILGGLTGLAGAIESARLVTGQPTAGEGYELRVIAAVVIGGGSLSGGQGSVMGTIIGALIMGVLANGANLLGISSFTQQIVIGAVIVMAVTFDEFQRRRLESSEA
ncbi:MAG: ABC transporter permease [Acidobacteria bacterium]|nr:ABC transporter permease [Acidobacteriota bacterium]MCW5967489.1 ABC transporter permease [Blastocatellales bacterium]